MRLPALAIVVWGCLIFPHGASAQARLDVLHAFTKPEHVLSHAPSPHATSITEASDGSFLLTSAGGGIYRKGAIFKVSPNGTVILLHSFRGKPDGAMPIGALLEASDGHFYGTTAGGGDADLGTVYRMTAGGQITILHSFAGYTGPLPDGAWPLTALIEGTDGYLYGSTSAGAGPLMGWNSGWGTLFRMTREGALTVFYNGDYSSGPTGPLMQAADGGLWVATDRDVRRFAIWDGCGCLTGPVMATLPYDEVFFGSLVETPEGIYAVSASRYGSTRKQTIRNLTTGATFSVPATSSQTNSIGALIEGVDGSLYGTTASDGAFGRGSLFRLTPAGVLEIVSSFASGRTGEFPAATLLQARDGNFYGTTATIDPPSPGAVFKSTPAGDMTFLATFDHASTGATSLAPLIEATDGQFYGTTSTGGAFGFGTIFRTNASGDVTLLYSFTGGRGGAAPSAALVQASDGSFYGTTRRGGLNDFGTVFRMDATGALAILHEFTGGSGGAFPASALVPGFDGNLYGTTAGFSIYDQTNGAGRGTAFRVTPGGQVTVLHVFAGGAADGANPIGPLVPLSDGTFVGMSAYGGSTGYGTVFSMTADGVVTILYELSGYDGDYSWYSRGIGVTRGIDGNAYAVQRASCKGTTGLLLKIATGGSVAVLREFECAETPMTLPVQAADGFFYGAGFNEAVYRWSGDGATSKLYSFKYDPKRPINRAVDGQVSTQLLQASDGRLYGTAGWEGPLGGGTIFHLRLFVGAARAMYVDTPLDGQHRVQPFDLSGWAIDQNSASGSGVDLIHVWAHPPTGSSGASIFVGATTTSAARPDIGRVFGEQFSAAGFGVTVRGLPPGTYEFVVSARSTETGTFAHSPALTVTVAADPRMNIDAPGSDTVFSGRLRIAGWAIDHAAAVGTGVDEVHVYAYPNPGSGAAPRFLGVAAYGSPRPDVAAAAGAAFTNSAFDLVVDDLPPGVHQLAVFAHSTVSGSLQQRRDQDYPGRGRHVDDDRQSAGRRRDERAVRRSAAGRSIGRRQADPASISSTCGRIRLPDREPLSCSWALASYGEPRPDVGAAAGAQFTNSGFSLAIAGLSPGDVPARHLCSEHCQWNVQQLRRANRSRALDKRSSLTTRAAIAEIRCRRT